MRSLSITPGKNGRDTMSIPASTDINGVSLLANTAESITIPAGSRFVLFNADADFYVSYTTTATVISDTTDGSGAELNPTVRSLNASDTISVISESACKVTACFYE